MKRGRILLRGALIFALVLTVYLVVFHWIEQRRQAKGPWRVTFLVEASGPTLLVNQPDLGIREVRIQFANQPVTSRVLETVEFSAPRAVPFDVPSGRCVFLDPLFLPGTVTLEIYGHEIQLMPRVLTIDKVERPWRSGETIVVEALRRK